jgi:hypothetical protein
MVQFMWISSCVSFYNNLTNRNDHSPHISLGLMSQPHFEGSVRSPLRVPKMGFGNPPGLPKTQNTIVGVKTPHIELFFIPLERSWNLGVQNGLAWAIWTFVAQVMVKKKGQKSNWQFDSWPLEVGNWPDPNVCRWSANTIEKLSRGATSLL